MKVLLGRRPTNAIIAVCPYLCNCLQLHYEKHILAIYLFSFCKPASVRKKRTIALLATQEQSSHENLNGVLANKLIKLNARNVHIFINFVVQLPQVI